MIRFTTAGESHGKALVAILEGIPAGLPLVAADVNRELKRRMGGYGRGARMQIEADQVEFLSGVRAGETLAGLARRYGVSIQALREANGLSEDATLKRGVRLKIPA